MALFPLSLVYPFLFLILTGSVYGIARSANKQSPFIRLNFDFHNRAEFHIFCFCNRAFNFVKIQGIRPSLSL